jgi:hypothetical protein
MVPKFGNCVRQKKEIKEKVKQRLNHGRIIYVNDLRGIRSGGGERIGVGSGGYV